ncbi:hypothetical conserved protein [Candidatus Nitrosoglobus terrae]|uniref:Hypothetical conserved protein n=1 Tax=Candidatus Nitrosoglobus terrae TaxID=1630141 RepID=A0A1Q2SKG6_9GAMM|nr:hypothetical protein [Candidatus Nitrosoglobus terrae]BAW79607.1 hypothetical conserved protein [Candidatus Nitrosoglobus terrae]
MGKTATDIREITLLIIQYPIIVALTAGITGIFALFFPLLAYVSGAIIGLVALERRIAESFIITIGAILPGVIITFFGTDFLGINRADIVLPLLLVLGLPNCICATLLRVSRSQSVALLAVGFFASLFVIGTHLFIDDVTLWWKQWLEQHVTLVPGATVQEFIDEGSLAFMNGIVSLFFSASLMFTLLLARKWQSFLHHSTEFQAEFRALRLPRSLALLVIGLAIMVTLKVIPGAGSLWVDLLIVAIMMYLFQGIAVLYALVTGKGLSAWWLTPLYIGLLFLPSLIIGGLALAGMADSLVSFKSSNSSRS